MKLILSLSFSGATSDKVLVEITCPFTRSLLIFGENGDI